MATAPEAPGDAQAEAIGDARAGGRGRRDARQRVRFILTELRRSGPTVVLNARFEPADPAGGRLQVASRFDDSICQPLEGLRRRGGDVFDGVALIDPERRKK